MDVWYASIYIKELNIRGNWEIVTEESRKSGCLGVSSDFLLIIASFHGRMGEKGVIYVYIRTLSYNIFD